MSSRRDFFKKLAALPLVGPLIKEPESIEQDIAPDSTADRPEPFRHYQPNVACRFSRSLYGEYMVKIGGVMMMVINAVIHTGDGFYFPKEEIIIDAESVECTAAIWDAHKNNKPLPYVLSTFLEGDREWSGDCIITSIEGEFNLLTGLPFKISACSYSEDS